MTNPIPPVSADDPVSLSPGHYTSTAILNNIFAKILSMITTLQGAAASQASRLTFLSGWQKSYTELQTKVPTFISGGTGPWESSSSDRAQQRADLNALNSNLSTTVQNRQSVVSDDAKALQSNVNQSNDAVNQQSNLGTSILQELGTLLSTIFK